MSDTVFFANIASLQSCIPCLRKCPHPLYVIPISTFNTSELYMRA